jgi:hypothetical protein
MQLENRPDSLRVMHSRFIKYLKVLVLFLALLGISGCASITRYSIESYQGPLLLDAHAPAKTGG